MSTFGRGERRERGTACFTLEREINGRRDTADSMELDVVGGKEGDGVSIVQQFC